MLNLPNKEIVSFDSEGLKSRLHLYEEHASNHELTLKELATAVGASFEEFQIEIHIVSCIRPGAVCLKFLSSYVKSDFQRQKELLAVSWMKSKGLPLSQDLICEKLAVDYQTAKMIVSQVDLDAGKKFTATGPAMFFKDFMVDQSNQMKVIKFFNENQYASLSSAIKALDLNISVSTLRNCIGVMIDNGYRIPCMTISDPMLIEAQHLDIIKFKQQNPYATDTFIGKALGISPGIVQTSIDRAAKEFKIEKIRSYEFYVREMQERLDKVCYESMSRHEASDKSSSKWLEIYQMGLEKQIKLLGLNAPTEIYINQKVEIESKEDRDKVIAAFFAADHIDIDETRLIEDI